LLHLNVWILLFAGEKFTRWKITKIKEITMGSQNIKPGIDWLNISDSELQSEYCRRFQISTGTRISNSREVVNHLRSFIGERDREHFISIFLSNKNEIIATEVLFKGSIRESHVYNREFMKRILRHEATAVMVAHNHPSGTLIPSSQDIAMTKRLKEMCALIDVTFHDHIIITAKGYKSLNDEGLFQ